MKNTLDEALASEKPTEIILGVSNPEKRIPKYCNAALYTRLKDGGVIITLLAREQVGFGEEAREESMVIERIYLDEDHAKAMAEKIIQLLSTKEDAK